MTALHPITIDQIFNDNQLNIDLILSDRCLLKHMTGFNDHSFAQLCKKFNEELNGWSYSPKKTQAGKVRRRKKGAGRRCRLLRVQDKVFFVLFYKRFHPTFEVAGTLFGVAPSSTQRWWEKLKLILEEISDKVVLLPTHRINSIEEFEALAQTWFY